MAKSDAERTPFGAWLVKQRKSRPGDGRDGTMRAEEVRQALKRERGYAIGVSAYAELESGTRLPTDEQRRHLEAWAGEAGPPNNGGGRGGSDDAIVAAIDKLTTEVAAQSSLLLALLGRLPKPDGSPLLAPDEEAHAIAVALQRSGRLALPPIPPEGEPIEDAPGQGTTDR